MRENFKAIVKKVDTITVLSICRVARFNSRISRLRNINKLERNFYSIKNFTTWHKFYRPHQMLTMRNRRVHL